MNDYFLSPPKVRRVVHVSPRCEGGKIVIEHTSPLVRLTPSSAQLVPVSDSLPVVTMKNPDASWRPLPKVSLPHSGLFQDYSNKSFGSKELTLSEFTVKPEALRTCDSVSTSSIDIEARIVDSAINSVMTLPQAFNEVVEMQKDQNNEIHKQQQLLTKYQEKFKDVEEKKEDLTHEVIGVTHKIYISEEQIRQCNKRCKEYEQEMKQLVEECEKERNRVKDLKEDIGHNQRQYDKYREIMTKHEQIVRDFEADLEVSKELKELKEAIANLETDDNNIIKHQEETDLAEDEVKGQIGKTRSQVEELKLLIVQKEELIQKEKSNQSQVEVSLNVLQKKNAAQLTRLKKQVKSALQSSRQWHDQIAQLQKSVVKLNSKLAQ